MVQQRLLQGAGSWLAFRAAPAAVGQAAGGVKKQRRQRTRFFLLLLLPAA